MARKGTLDVDVHQLNVHARNMDTMALGLNGAELALKQIDEMGAYWEGGQRDAFVQEYRSTMETLNNAVKQFKKFTESLLGAAEIYQEMEPEVQSIVGTLHQG